MICACESNCNGDEDEFCFYNAQYFSAEDIKNSFNKVDIYGSIYLFSCEGGRGNIASTIAATTNCTVIASVYKVSFGVDSARCGWSDYMRDYYRYGNYAWYSYFPGGNNMEYSIHWVCTQ